ncbi:MAG: CBS domain-containing protein [Acidimicrobiia bacterium]|nr:CBS domain-containing protein [Acidimicrobiia bacterium]NNL28348.1 CBS domain-containing protein [Acidimicrobiia bacterium]
MTYEKGAKMKIRELVGGSAFLCGPDLTMTQAAEEMSEQKIGALAVTEKGELIGVITERDILRAVAQHATLQTTTVREWMTTDPDTIGADVNVEEAASWLLTAGYRHLPVMDNGELIGMASIKDVLWSVFDASKVADA